LNSNASCLKVPVLRALPPFMQIRLYLPAKKVGVVICGGNIDPRLLASILNRNMAVDGRIARLRIDISDEPGMLAAISTTIGKCGGNIVEIYHQRPFL
jgi:threonine dehydratase